MHTFDTLDKLPQRCAAALNIEGSLIAPKYSSIVLVGTGDALLAASLYQAATMTTSDWPVVVTSDWSMPAFVRKGTLAIFLSETGSDPVTVDALSHAVDLGATVAVIAPGGQLIEMAIAQDYPMRQIASPLVRGTPLLGELFFALWGLLHDLVDAKASIDLLTRQRKLFGPEAVEDTNPARLLTSAFHGRQPLLCGTTPLARVAVDIWVDRLRSTGLPAYAGSLDLDTDLTRWPATTSTRTPVAEALILRDVNEPAGVDDQIAALRKALGSTVSVNELSMDGRTALERLWGAIYLAEWTAFYLAP